MVCTGLGTLDKLLCPKIEKMRRQQGDRVKKVDGKKKRWRDVQTLCDKSSVAQLIFIHTRIPRIS